MVTSVSWLLASFEEDEVVLSKGAGIFGRKKYATLFTMGYLSLYLLSLGTIVVCRVGSANPRFGREGSKYNPWLP